MSERLRIIHVAVSDKFAGVERYLCTTARHQAAAGHQVAVIGGAQGRMAAELHGAPVLLRAGNTLAQAWSALRLLPNPDVVHAHMTAGELTAVAARPISPVVVTTRHFAQFRGSSTASRAAGKLVAQRISLQIAISDFVEAHVEPGRTVVVRPGVPDRPDRSENSRAPVVLVAQRLEQEKRTDIALRVWAASGLAERGWQLHLAGTGALRKQLEALAVSLHVEQSCVFLGQRSDVAELLTKAAIVLAPRHDEPYGLSVVEAMAAGTPIVAGAGGGHNETVGRCEDAMLFPPEGIDIGGTMLAQLATNRLRQNSYGRSLQEFQRRQLSEQQQTDLVVAAYREVLGR